MDRYHPGYFGKVGMRYFHKQGNHFWKPVINLDKRPSFYVTMLEHKLIFTAVWSLVPVEQREKYLANKKADTAPVLDLLSFGYSKVLGKGRLPEIPLVVRARFFSAEAEKKLKEAGCVIQLVG
jgi:large subunit ribosomal protein L27Ae